MYKLIGENNIENAREQILKNRGIDENLLNVNEEVIEDYMLYDNIIEGCELLMRHIENGSKICVVIDSDVDGITSASLFINYIRREFPNINLITKHHLSKKHGVADISFEEDIDFIVILDASTNDREEIELLYKRGKEVLIIDHHELEGEYPKYGVLINSQTSTRVKNKYLSAVGIVYKFLCAFSDYYYLDNPYEFIDIVALGNIADVMDARVPETRYYIKEGLKNIKNPFIKALMEEKSFEMEGKVSIMTIGWNVSPLLNGCIRSGTMLEKEKLYNAMIGDEDCKEVARICKNAKARQDNSVKKSMEKIENGLILNEDDKLIIASSCGASKSQTGLIAGKIASKYKKPVLLYSNQGNVLSGSARGIGDIDLKQDLINSKMGNGIGHARAFGFSFENKYIDDLKVYFNNLYKDIDFGSKEYTVDFELDSFEVYQEFIDEIAFMESEWGNGIEPPLIAIKNFKLDLNSTNLKGKLNVVWNIYGVKCIKKFTSKVWKEEFLNKNITVDIIGKCTIDSYTNKGCIEIVDLSIIN